MTAPSLPSSIRLLGGEGGLPRVDIATSLASAHVYVHGAHLAAWHPSNLAKPVLWLSDHSSFERDKPIRGGVPICFPWFGPHANNPRAPAHGFARLADWTLVEAHESTEGTVALAFSLCSRDAASPEWPHPFQITYRVTIGVELTMRLEVQNSGEEPFSFEEALHTYFAVADIEQVAITGLGATDYLDKTAGFARRTQGDEPIRFTGETDRVYVDTTSECVIHDPGLQRRIAVGKSGSRSTVVWNPWIEKARAMPDFGDDEWREMVCVETANIGDAAIRIEPGTTHAMTAEISILSLTGDN